MKNGYKFYDEEWVSWYRFYRKSPFFYYDDKTKRYFLIIGNFDTCGFTKIDAHKRFKKEYPHLSCPNKPYEVEQLWRLSRKVGRTSII